MCQRIYVLEYLDCNNNLLPSLNVSNNMFLYNINCKTINSLTNLDLSNNANLEYLRIQDNYFVDIDLSPCLTDF